VRCATLTAANKTKRKALSAKPKKTASKKAAIFESDDVDEFNDFSDEEPVHV